MKNAPSRQHIDGTKRTVWEKLEDFMPSHDFYIGIAVGAFLSVPVWLSVLGGQS